MSCTKNLIARRGDTFIKPLVLTRADPVTRVKIPVNIIGCSFVFSMKKRIADIDYVHQESLVITDAENGKMTLEISKDITEEFELRVYEYDIQMTDSLGKVHTYMIGKFNVVYDITTNI